MLLSKDERYVVVEGTILLHLFFCRLLLAHDVGHHTCTVWSNFDTLRFVVTPIAAILTTSGGGHVCFWLCLERIFLGYIGQYYRVRSNVCLLDL